MRFDGILSCILVSKYHDVYGKYSLVQLDKTWNLNWVLRVKGNPPYTVQHPPKNVFQQHLFFFPGASLTLQHCMRYTSSPIVLILSEMNLNICVSQKLPKFTEINSKCPRNISWWNALIVQEHLIELLKWLLLQSLSLCTYLLIFI